MAVIPVELAGRSYEVRVGTGLLADLGHHCKDLLRKQNVPIITDAHVHAAWGEVINDALHHAGHQPQWRILPAGEGRKSWDELAATVNWLLQQGVERGDNILALGGGVIGDLTGFAAAIVKRGCHFIQLPTTLLAQVDSSVGGKTAINTPAGKNLVGAFHQPSLVIADLTTLDTLPMRELQAGYAEVLKYGLLGDADFFAWCEAHGKELIHGDMAAREYAVAQSVAAKARIVALDERETSGARALLNLGHTFGHALEAETSFSSRLLHGEAVAIGMALAARYSARCGLMPTEQAERAVHAIASAGLMAELHELALDCTGVRLAEHMLHDKKMDAGTLPFVLMRGIGDAFLDHGVKLDDVAAFLDEELARR